jgi:phosphatidylserine synthase
MNLQILEIAVLIIGLAVGAGAMIVARRTADSREQAVSRQKTIQYVALTLIAAVLIVDAVDTPRHRWLDAVVLVLMACGVAFDCIRGRRTTTRSG